LFLARFFIRNPQAFVAIKIEEIVRPTVPEPGTLGLRRVAGVRVVTERAAAVGTA
jgi:hypothetical protein